MRGVLAASLATGLVVILAQPVFTQMMGGGRTAQPARPLPPGMKAPQVRYEDLAAKAGLNGINVSGSDKQQAYIVENTGTGVAIFDFDNDGLMDLFFVNGDRFDRNPNAPPTHHLYRNLGGLRFEDVTTKSGIAHTDWGQGVCAGDIDNDGFVDLYIGYWGHNVLYRNQGNGTFRDETKERGLASTSRRWGTGCAFLDYDRDGNLDLFVAHYLAFDPSKVAKPGEPGSCVWKGFPVVCGPMGLPPETMSLYHNEGGGKFRDVTEASGVGSAKAAGLSVLTADFDNDGWLDVYVTGDSTPSLHFLNLRNGKFEEVGQFTGIAYNEDGHEQSGMGTSAGDYDRDGNLDLVKTNFTDDIPNLYRNMGNGSFSEVTVAAGIAVHTEYVNWGTAFLDFDQDGWKDIFIVSGHVYPDIDMRNVGQSFKQPRLLYWNRRDGQFFDISAQGGPGILARHSSRGIALGDLDNDGDQEIVVVNMHESPSLLKNLGEKGNSILIQALTKTGRDAIGARLTLTAGGKSQVDEVRSGGFYVSQGDFRVHFGLGGETKADLKIRWPDGSTESFSDLLAGYWVTLRQGAGIMKTRKLGKE
ncbi:MAG TPA: CRTAC1 family protein [Bryobacteraceae bacterium]|nr:CRTAC1 family protein [Bryobacteraceae bacterium]